MTKKVLLNPNELADRYALKILYDWLTPLYAHRRLERRVQFAFYETPGDSPREQEVTGSAKKSADPICDLCIGCYSDVSDGLEYPDIARTYPENARTLGIDISILKNSAIPLKSETKKSLRTELGIIAGQPVAVISYPNQSVEIGKVINALWPYTNIYILNWSYPLCGLLHGLPDGAMKKIHFVNEFGILKKYYACADLAFIGSNLAESYSYMHNFIEATENGPLFAIPPMTRQYGFKELADVGVIRRCNDLDTLLTQSLEFVRHFKDNKEHCAKRSEHIRQTRRKYLPVIGSYVDYMLNMARKPLKSELKAVRFRNGQDIQLCHPSTSWRC